ncbi:PPE domain-containing protein [Saccharomonospora sp. NPDC006951]
MATEGPLSAGAIFWQINAGDGGDQLFAAQEAARKLREELASCADEVRSLGKAIEAGWQGQAGDAAANAATPLAQASTQDSDLLDVAHGSVTEQLTAFGHARHAIVPVPDRPTMTPGDLLSSVTYEDRLREHEEIAHANIQAFAAYHQASTTNGETMPSGYTPLTDPGAPIRLADDTGQTQRTGSAATPVAITGGHIGRTPSTPDGTPRTAATTRSATGPANAATTASAYPPPTSTPAQRPERLQFGPTGKPAGGLGAAPWFSPASAERPAAARNPGAQVRAGGPRATAGNTGRPGLPVGGRGPAAPGKGTGALPSAPAARSAPITASPAPGRSAMGMPMGATTPGRGKDDEDRDRRAPAYLRNPDPDDTFAGPFQQTTPPVIGERKDR